MAYTKRLWRYLLLLVFIASADAVRAQENDNPRYPFYYGSVEYQKPSTMTKISGLLGVLDGKNGYQNITAEDKSMTDGLTEAIHAAATSIYRLIVQQGDAPDSASEESYVLNVTLKNVMSGSNKYGSTASADVIYQLVNLESGKEVANVKTGCSYSMCRTTAEAIAGLNGAMTATTVKFLTACFPLTGTILQKDVEQNNGKIKEDQCYIDLGDKFGVYEKLKFLAYTEDGGKLEQIGELKLKGTEGDDIGICAITKGYKKIAQVLSDGQTVIIRSNEKIK